MKTFEHILVPTDFEPASAGALALATSLAQTFGAKVTLLHVWEIPIYPYMDVMLNSDLIDRVQEAAIKQLGDALDVLRLAIPGAESELKRGLPWQEILDVVQTRAPDLVVMGTHGRQGARHVFLGSVAERVVRQCRVPVLTVHAAPPAR